jgi:hypothetical protein
MPSLQVDSLTGIVRVELEVEDQPVVVIKHKRARHVREGSAAALVTSDLAYHVAQLTF